ncbi:hypothetical protein CVT25_012143 [Psilocybe cyanescens]|uniref:Uncharacterized protein n=1 Tax=Psilocybe cyanescens TaxID=93625 RepID=A0A409XFE4_PSICY|nr:hypothetical protein CVT25_012143 [Psilocybe cyanescens]
MSIQEAGIKFCDPSEELEYESDPENETTKPTINTTSELWIQTTYGLKAASKVTLKILKL